MVVQDPSGGLLGTTRTALGALLAQGRRLRVLVVDDEPVNVVLLRRMVRSLGHEAIGCDDGDEVFDALATQEALHRPVDLILLDIVMPRLSGDIVCRLLREHGSRLPVVATTCNTSPADVALYREVGFTTVLGKPFDEERLYGVLHLLPAEHSGWISMM